jgi:hypothetical protein
LQALDWARANGKEEVALLLERWAVQHAGRDARGGGGDPLASSPEGGP